jgi:hypothetical protein
MRRQSDWALVPAMFIRPRRTVATIVAGERYAWVPMLALIGGAVDALQRVSFFDPALPRMTALLVAVIGGGLAGVLGLYASGWLFGICGRWFGGRASARALRAALAWGWLPSLAMGLIFIAKVGLVGWDTGSDLMRSGASVDRILTVAALDVAALVLALWSLVTSVAAVSEVQGITAAKTVGSFLAAGVMVGVALMAAIALLAILRD